MLWQRAPGVGITEDWFSPAQYFDIRESTASLEHVAVTFGQEVTLTGDETEPTRLGAMRVSSSFFDVMGIAPLHGRRFDADDDIADAPRKVLLGHRLYTQRFGADPSIVGEIVTIDGQRLEIVGVMAPLMLDADMMPTLLTVPVFDMLLSFPLADPQRTTRGSENYNIIGKLAAGATRAQLDAGVATAFSRDPGSLAAGLSAGSEFFIDVVPLLDQVGGGARSYLVVLLGATAVLLMIACANVANLLLTRAATQRRELTIRSSLGAQRWRMIVQAMLESVLLSVLGGAVGLAIALIAIQALHAAAPDELPRLAEVTVDPSVLLFAGILCLLSSALFGIGPALRTSAVSPSDVLRETAPSVRARSVWRRGGSRFLVVAQVALSLLLLIGAGLLVRTFAELRSIDPGFRPAATVSFRVSLAGGRYNDGAARVRFYEQLFARLRSTPGISAAGGTSLLPLTRGLAWTDYLVEGFNEDNPDARIVADIMTTIPGYVEAMGINVIAGRSFTASDEGDPPVVMVNRMFAERFWPAEAAVGKWIATDPARPMTIIGVVETVRHYGVDADTRPAVFYPHRGRANRALFGVVTQDVGKDPPGGAGVATNPTVLVPAVLDAVRELDPQVPVYKRPVVAVGLVHRSGDDQDVAPLERLRSESLAHLPHGKPIAPQQLGIGPEEVVCGVEVVVRCVKAGRRALSGRKRRARIVVAEVTIGLRPGDGGQHESDEENHEERDGERSDAFHQPVPVDPKPPSPRVVSPTSSTSVMTTWVTGAITSCAIRSPRSMVNRSPPRFIRMTLTSPR